METITELPLLTAQSNVRSLRERQAATRAILDSFMEQEEDEHRDTLRVLRQALGTAYAAADSLSHWLIASNSPACCRCASRSS